MSEWEKYLKGAAEYLTCLDGDIDIGIYSKCIELTAERRFGDHGVRMTPTQARMVAAKLIELADSLEKQGDLDD